MAHQVAHAFDHHNASLSEGAPSLLWSGPCLESLVGGGLARISRVGCDNRGGAAPSVSPPRRCAAPGGGVSGGSDPVFFGAGAPPGRGKWATLKATIYPPLRGVAPSTVIPGGKAIERLFALTMDGCVSPCSFRCQWASKIAGFWALKIAGFWAPKVAGSARWPAEGAERPERGSGPEARSS